MTLRVRMGIAAGIAVAIAVIAVAFSAYAGTRSQLQGQLDNRLMNLAKPILISAGVINAPPPGPGGPQQGHGGPGAIGGPGPGESGITNDCDGGLGLDRTRGGGLGGPQGYVQLVRADGSICLATGETTRIPTTSEIKALAARGSGHFNTDAQVGSTHLRVLVYGVGSRGALMVALPRTDVDNALSRQLLLLIVIAAAGVALAALLGILVARTALAPIARFTRQTEAIAANPERLEHDRLDVEGNDELARLARTFNATLDALEQSIQSQRNLVADASHELRTPIASLRANLQLLRDEALLSGEDRAALRTDMIEELDELTGLVGDVVELARGSKPSPEPGEVRFDQIVAQAVDRARRRGPRLTVTADLEPTLVRGEGDRISRAVSNLLDNAAKWSPPDGTIEVDLHRGTLTVRDHGAGFNEEDLPFVFDRFHRAKDARSKPGSGLGLAIVRQAAEAHGGFVEAGNAPGGGALIRIGFGPPLELGDQAPETAVNVPQDGAASRSCGCGQTVPPTR